MTKARESLERLVMPDDMFKEQCKKLGIGYNEDYKFLKEELQRLEGYDNLFNDTNKIKWAYLRFTDYEHKKKVLFNGKLYDLVYYLKQGYKFACLCKVIDNSLWYQDISDEEIFNGLHLVEIKDN